jgi:hypothetical protein
MIVAPATESISIDDGSPKREFKREDVVRTVAIPLRVARNGAGFKPFTEA